MIFTFVRHGETDYNKRKVMTGRFDSPLNDEGRMQAKEAIAEIKDDHDVIFASSLSRAVETAKIINEKFNLPILITDLIIERDFGTLTGKTWEELSEIMNCDARAIDKAQKYDYRSYGGESAEDVSKRLMQFVEETKASKYKKPLVVCHGGILRMLHARRGEEFGHIKNAAVEEFDL